MTTGEHLDDAALMALLAGEAEHPGRAHEHLASCAPCARTHAALRTVQTRMLDDERDPSPFVSARLERRLFGALSGLKVAPPPVVRRSRAAAAVAVAALSGAAIAMTADRPILELSQGGRAGSGPAAVAPLEAVRPAPLVMHRVQPRVPASQEPDRPEATPRASVPPRTPPARTPTVAPSAPAVPSAAPSSGSGVQVAVAPGTPRPQAAMEAAYEEAARAPREADWVSLGDGFVQVGASGRALDAWVRGLDGSHAVAAAQRLATVVRDGTVSVDGVLDRLEEASLQSAEALRLRCELGLKHRGDRAAVASCRAFGRAFPAHPATRALAMAAGQVAETRLDDLPLAVEEYSRALVVSKYAGVPGSEALLARARARSRLGDHEEAQADLRLYLHVSPEAWRQPEIRELAATLRVPAP